MSYYCIENLKENSSVSPIYGSFLGNCIYFLSCVNFENRNSIFGPNVEFNSVCRPKKRRCKKLLMNSLSEADWLSEMHPHGEASSSLSGWETLEEDKSEICALNTQLARPVTMLSLLALSAPMLA